MDPVDLTCRIPAYVIPQDFPMHSYESVVSGPIKIKSRGSVDEILVDTIDPASGYNPAAVYCDTQWYDRLLTLKADVYSQKQVDNFKHRVYPYANASNGGGMNRCFVKLANLDKVFDLTGHYMGALSRREDFNFTYADIAGGPGGFTQYIQYRNKRAFGYGITLKTHIDWNIEKIDTTRFKPIYGPDTYSDGNLFTCKDEFISIVQNQESPGVDLVVADGGLSIPDNEADRQEFLNSRLIITEMFTGLSCVRPGGHFVCKMYDTVTEISAVMIYALSRAFKTITLFKQAASTWTNSEKYLVCKSRNEDVSESLDLLDLLVSEYKDNKFVINTNIQLPYEFVSWLTERNNVFTQQQYRIAYQLWQLLNGEKINEIRVDLRKFMINLDLTDVPSRSRVGCDKPQPRQQRGKSVAESGRLLRNTLLYVGAPQKSKQTAIAISSTVNVQLPKINDVEIELPKLDIDIVMPERPVEISRPPRVEKARNVTNKPVKANVNIRMPGAY